MTEKKKGILAVSFGTRYADTRKKTITAIETAIRNAHPDIPVYTAWTSRILRAKLLKTNGENIPDVSEALLQMSKEHISDVYIQTTHIINGFEYDSLREDVLRHRSLFSSVSLGEPLLSSDADMEEAIGILADAFADALSYPADSESALVLMGHGSGHRAGAVYAVLNDRCKELGYPNLYVGTAESTPSVGEILTQLKKTPVKSVHLAPFLIVAGEHASKDMAGDSDTSWASLFRKAGYHVTCHLKGLGEYPEIRAMFLKHLDKILT